MAATLLAACINLAGPDQLTDLQPGWNRRPSRKQLDRWTDNIVRAPQWIRWRAAASDARGRGIEPLVTAIEAGEVAGPQILPVFEYAYAKWVADEIVNSDETLSSFLAEHHEAAIEAFSAADDRVAELSKQIVLARIGGGVPGMTSFGVRSRMGNPRSRGRQEDAPPPAAPAVRQDPDSADAASRLA